MSVETFDPTKRPDGRELGPESMETVLSRFENGLSDRSRPVAGAMRAWLAVSGKRGRVHTRGVYVVEPTAPGRPRVLKVYVDSNPVVSDMRANSEVYAVKLAHAGLEVDAVEFRLSRKVGMERGVREVAALEGGTTNTSVRDSRETSQRKPASAAWKKKVGEMLASVESEELRTSLRKAMIGE